MKRLGKNSKPLYPDELSNVYSSIQNPDFSGRIISESTIDDVNKLEVYSLKEKLRVRDSKSTLPDLEDNDFLRDLQLTKYDGDVERLTVAGLLFVGKEASIQRLLPQAEVIYLHYSSDNLEEYRESSSRKRNIKNEEQYREYQIWHVGVQKELDKLKQEKRGIKKQLQLADGIVKEDLYTAYYVVSGKEEIVADRDVDIPGMEKEAVSEKDVAVEPETNVEVVNPDNNQNNTSVMPDIRNASDVNTARRDEDITDVTGKSEFMESEEKVSVDKAGWIVRRISELGGYENISDSVKADIFGFDIADVSGSIWLFSDVMKRLGIKLDGDEMYEEFQRIYDESVGRDAGKDKAEDKMWNRGRGR